MKAKSQQKIEIVPSLLSADFSNLKGQLGQIEAAGCSKLHLDIMDGHFVPNISFGPAVIRSIREVSGLFFQAHFMISRPERHVESFKQAGVDGIVIHEEICGNVSDTLRAIRAVHLKAGIALKPKTPVRTIEEIAEELDYLLIMSVEPGFSGQVYINGSEEKIVQAKELFRKRSLQVTIGVDGGINLQTVCHAVVAGADELVCGTAVFSGDIVQNIRSLTGKANEMARKGKS